MKYTHPIINYDFVDESGGSFLETDNMPLYRPVFVVKAQKGQVNKLVWYPDYPTAEAQLGAETFNRYNSEFHCRDIFLLKDALKTNGAFVIRLGDDGMAKAATKVVAAVTGDSTAFQIKYTAEEVVTSQEGLSELDTFENKPVSSDPALQKTNEVSGTTTFSAFSNIPGYVVKGTEITLTEFAPVLELDGPWDDISKVNFAAIFNVSDLDLGDFEFDEVTGLSGERAYKIPVVNNTLILPPAGSGEVTFRILAYGGASAFNEDADSTEYDYSTYLYNCNGLNTSFELMGVEAFSEGKFGNTMAFDIAPYQDIDLEYSQRLGAYPLQLTFGQFVKNLSTIVAIPTVMSSDTFSFTTNENIIDPSTQSSSGLATKLALYFNSEIKQPMRVVLNKTHIKAFYTLLESGLVYQISHTGNWEHWEVLRRFQETPEKLNILNLSMFIEQPIVSGAPLAYGDPSAILANGAVSCFYNEDKTNDIGGLTPNVWLMLNGGSDGALDVDYPLDARPAVENQNIIQKKIAELWSTVCNSELCDMPRCPFNYIVDSGHTNMVKNATMNIFNCRKDVLPLYSAWTGTNPKQYTETTAILNSNSLVTSLRMYRASLQYGTKAYRAVLMNTIGYVSPLEFDGALPHTAWINRRMAELCSGQSITANIEGSEAVCDMFIENKVVPYKESTKALMWGMGGNYAQHWSPEGIHYASIRTIYEDETSNFSTLAFVNATIFLTQKIPAIWKDFAGSTKPRKTNYTLAKRRLSEMASTLLNGIYTFDVKIYQTAEDKASRIADTVDFSLYGEGGQRIWNFKLIGKDAGGE